LSNDGDYSNNLGSTFWIISPEINCSYFINVTFSFYRYLNVEEFTWDKAKIEVSNDNSSWTEVFRNPLTDIIDSAWTPFSYDISSTADNKSTVYIRFGIGTTDDSVRYSGWNIDDLLIFGNYNLSGPNINLTGESQTDKFGWSLAGAGDINNDNIDDIIIGAPGARNVTGNAYVFFGGSGLISKNMNHSDLANIELLGAISGDQFGFSVGSAGDVDGDTITDFIIGAPYNDTTATNAGAAYIFYGRGSYNLSYSALHANNTLTGEAANDNFGWSVGGDGNINNDDKNDTFVGAPYFDNISVIDAGRVYIHCIPEYSDYLIPLFMMFIALIIVKKRSIRKKK
jgi:hypothetical protein